VHRHDIGGAIGEALKGSKKSNLHLATQNAKINGILWE
jgi:hypothetical protein